VGSVRIQSSSMRASSSGHSAALMCADSTSTTREPAMSAAMARDCASGVARSWRPATMSVAGAQVHGGDGLAGAHVAQRVGVEQRLAQALGHGLA
jgi:hypothetical protein